MDIGIETFPTDYSIDIATLASRAEELGFESLWLPEHPILPVTSNTPYPGSPDGKVPRYYADIADPFIALARASAVTTDLKLGTGICLVPERNPLLLAKEIATLDMYSHGRFLFGIGAGWLREETELMGGDFAHRWSQTREAVLAMKELWTTTESEYHGRYYDFAPVYSFPRPTQRPHPPVYLGGSASNVFKRVVAWGDGWLPSGITPEQVKHGRATLDDLADKAGRDPGSLNISVMGQKADRELVGRFQKAGADRVIVEVSTANEEESLAELERIAEAVLG